MKKILSLFSIFVSFSAFSDTEIISPQESEMNARTQSAKVENSKVIEITDFATHCGQKKNGLPLCTGWLGEAPLIGFSCRDFGDSTITFKEGLRAKVSDKQKCELINQFVLRTLKVECEDVLSHTSFCRTETNVGMAATHTAIFTITEKSNEILKVEFKKL